MSDIENEVIEKRKLFYGIGRWGIKFSDEDVKAEENKVKERISKDSPDFHKKIEPKFLEFYKIGEADFNSCNS